MRLSGSIVFFGIAAAAIIQGAAGHPSTQPSKAMAAKSIDALMKQGSNALSAEEYRTARDSFLDLLALDIANPHARIGAAIAYLEMGDFTRARENADKALIAPGHSSAAMAVDAAAIFLRSRNPMHAAKVLKEYLSAPTATGTGSATSPSAQTVPDEFALNALAIALVQADDSARKTTFYRDAANFYDAQTIKLEASKPGMKRFGTEWLPADEADRKIADWKSAVARSSTAANRLSFLRNRLAASQQELAKREQMVRNGKAAQWYADQVSRDCDNLQNDIVNAQNAYDKSLIGAERPPVPTTITLLNINDDGTAIAAVTAEPTPEMKPAQVASANSGRSNRPSPPGDSAGSSNDASPPTPPADVPPPAVDSNPLHPKRDPNQKVQITTYAAAFPVAKDLVVTTAAAVADAQKIELQTADGAAFEATLVRTEGPLALLKVDGTRLIFLKVGDAFSGGAMDCVSFPSVNLFQPTAEVIHGTGTAPAAGWTVRLSRNPRLGGGPLVSAGAVVGVQLASRDSDPGSIPAAGLDDLKKLIGSDLPATGGIGDAVGVTLQLSAVREK